MYKKVITNKMMWEVSLCDDGWWEAYPLTRMDAIRNVLAPIGRGKTVWEAITKSARELRKLTKDDGKDFLV